MSTTTAQQSAPLAEFAELELIYSEGPWPVLIVCRGNGVCWCKSENTAKTLLFSSGYIPTGNGLIWRPEHLQTNTLHPLTVEDTSTILAALRFWKHERERACGAIHAISTNDGQHYPYNDQQIEELCERLNCGEPAERVAIILEGGLVQAIVAEHPDRCSIRPIVIDYDTQGAHPDELTDVDQGDGTTVPACVTQWLVTDAHITLPAEGYQCH